MGGKGTITWGWIQWLLSGYGDGCIDDFHHHHHQVVLPLIGGFQMEEEAIRQETRWSGKGRLLMDHWTRNRKGCQNERGGMASHDWLQPA